MDKNSPYSQHLEAQKKTLMKLTKNYAKMKEESQKYNKNWIT